MATTNITMRIDEELKKQAEELFNNLGLNMTAAFTMFAKQAVREQALPFRPTLNPRKYDDKDYLLAMKNTKYNDEGKPVIEKDDEWRDEIEWDDIFEQMKKERGIQ